MIDDRLLQLVSAAWLEYVSHVGSEYVVRPSIPILYFGDLNGYLASSLRVITAALNPSWVEFPPTDRFQRFAQAQGVTSDAQPVPYLRALNAYFTENPYRQWFGSIEPVLEGLNASFYPGRSSVALPTDLCTALATKPTWTGLPENVRSRLRGPGQQIWHDLVEYLQPDVILVSVAEAYLSSVPFETLRSAEPIFTVLRDRFGALRNQPYVATSRLLRLTSGKVTRLVFGRAAQTPFGLISDQHKRDLGRAVLEAMRHA
jgi:hypothetical protein